MDIFNEASLYTVQFGKHELTQPTCRWKNTQFLKHTASEPQIIDNVQHNCGAVKIK